MGPLATDVKDAVKFWNKRVATEELLNTKRVLEERVAHLTRGLKGVVVHHAAAESVRGWARRALEENNEGDVPAPDGIRSSEGQAGVG